MVTFIVISFNSNKNAYEVNKWVLYIDNFRVVFKK